MMAETEGEIHATWPPRLVPTYAVLTLDQCDVQVVTIMDYTGAYVEEGFFVPADYGEIASMSWLPNHRRRSTLNSRAVRPPSTPLRRTCLRILVCVHTRDV